MTRPITVLVHHQRGTPPVEVNSVVDLDDLLDRIHSDPARKEAPPRIELVSPDETRALDIGQARPEYSVVIWHDNDADEVFTSSGTVTVDTDAAFDFGGT